MTEPNKYFRNCNLIVEIAVVFALATCLISSMGHTKPSLMRQNGRAMQKAMQVGEEKSNEVDKRQRTVGDSVKYSRRVGAGQRTVPPKTGGHHCIFSFRRFMQDMPITFMRDLTEGPRGSVWYFFFVVTPRQGSAVGEVRALDLAHETVLQIYRESAGKVPATGLERQDVLTNWENVEPRLRIELGKRGFPEATGAGA